MAGSEVYVERAVEQLRLAHLKLVAADSHLRCVPEEANRLARVHGLSAELARLILELEPPTETPLLEGEARVR